MRRSPTPAPSSTPPISPSPPTSRTATATHPRRRPRRSASPEQWGWSAAPSRTPPAIPGGRSTTSSTRSNGSQPPPQAARALPFPFILVGRAENFLHGRPDLDDTIRRLQAFEAAGADALFAPGLTTAEQIRTVCQAVGKPVNVVMGLKNAVFTVAELASLGVRRISLGSSLSRAALGALLRAAREIQEQGSFGFAAEAVSYPEINRLMGG